MLPIRIIGLEKSPSQAKAHSLSARFTRRYVPFAIVMKEWPGTIELPTRGFSVPRF
jgi:hypothetical protein